MSNCRALMDVYHPNSEISNTYAEHVLAGKPLVSPLKCLTVTGFTLQSGTPSFDVNIARSISRANSILVTLHGQTSATIRDVTTFISASPEQVQGRIHKQWPDGVPVSRISQFWYRLLSGLGALHSASHTIAIKRGQYENGSFIWLSDLEKVPVATSTGYNCAKGELITVSMKNMSNTHQRATVTCHHDVVMELRDSGCDVLV